MINTKTTTRKVMKMDSRGFGPKQYMGPPKNESPFSFRNFYIEYSRFHTDDCNIWIHIVFIPQLLITLFGLLLFLPESFRQIQIEPEGT